MRYLILGASAAGLSAARAIRETDASGEITVVSKEKEIYSRPMLHHIISGQRKPEGISFIDSGFFSSLNVRWLSGREAVGLNTENMAVTLSDGLECRYDRLLIATGASPVMPPVENLARGRQVFSLRTLEDARGIVRLSEKVSGAVVIGAGLVGMDAACALSARGIEVSVVEMAPNILPLQLDRGAAGRYEKLCLENNINLLLNDSVLSVDLDSRGNVWGVRLKSGRLLPCGMVIVAAGVRPSKDFLRGTPVEVGRGVKVDEFQQTSAGWVYAAGDVCESMEAFTGKVGLTPVWPSAVRQGEVAGRNMAGIPSSMEKNFAFMNSMNFFGIPTVSFGHVTPPDRSFGEIVRRDSDTYKKVILRDGRIRGAILQGDISNAGLYGALVRDGADISPCGDRVLDLTFADFFRQREDGEFCLMR